MATFHSPLGTASRSNQTSSIPVVYPLFHSAHRLLIPALTATDLHIHYLANLNRQDGRRTILLYQSRASSVCRR